MKQYDTCVVWLTGLSAAGKTTIAAAIRERFVDTACKVHHLDGDEVRKASKEQLGFSKADRDKNIKLAIELARQYQDDGHIVIASFISPYREHRQWGRERLKNYIEVFVNTPLAICETRDPKGLYRKARAGEIAQFTGIDDPYEVPDRPDLELKTDQQSVDQCVENILNHLAEQGYIGSH